MSDGVKCPHCGRQLFARYICRHCADEVRAETEQQLLDLRTAALALLENIDCTSTEDTPILQVHVSRQRVEALRTALDDGK